MKPGLSDPPGFYKASFLLLIFNNLASALHYGFQCMMGRNLSTADFGLMNALFGLAGFLALPAGVYVNALARQWAELCNASRHAEAERLWFALATAALFFCAAIAAIALVFAPWFAWWLNTANLPVVRLTILGGGVGMVLSLAAPFITARQWFAMLAMGSVLGALIRIALGWIGIQAQAPLGGAVMATTLYSGVWAGIVFSKVSWPGWSQLPFEKLLLPRREWMAPCLMALATYTLCGVDILIVRRFYQPEDAGLFAQVITLGRIILFLVGPISMVVFPKAATSLQTKSRDADSRILHRAIKLGAVLLIVAAAVLCALAPQAFVLLRGSWDPEVVGYLRIAVWCLIPLSLCQLAAPALFASRQERCLLEFTLICGLLPIGLALFHTRLLHAFLVEGAVGLVLLGFVWFRLRPGSRPSCPGESDQKLR